MIVASRTVVYLADAAANEIALFALDSVNGRLAPVARTSLEPGVTPLALRPDGRVLYAGLRSERPAVAAFAVDAATGRLSPLGKTPLADPPMYLATDTSGAYLMSASYAAATFTVNALRSDGNIDPVPIVHQTTPPQAHAVITDRSNRFAFVTCLGGDCILQFEFDASTGRVRPNRESAVATAAGSGPRHIVLHPAGAIAYVNGELDGSIASFALDADTGRLAPLHRASMFDHRPAATPWAAELVVRPDGRFLYASERRTSTIAIFALDGQPGTLERRAIVSTEEQPRSIAIDPTGSVLLVAGERSQHLSVYAIDAASGELQPVARVPAGQKPVWLTLAVLPRDASG